MNTLPDYFELAADFARQQFTPDRLVDRLWSIEVAERAIRERNTERIVKAVRDTLYAETTDPRRI